MLILRECSISKTRRITFTPTPSKTKSSSPNSIKIWSQPKIIFITKSDPNNYSLHSPNNKSPRSKPSSKDSVITPSLLNFGDNETLLSVQLLPSFSPESFNIHSLTISSCLKLISNDSFWSFRLANIPYSNHGSFALIILDSFGILFWKLSQKSQRKASKVRKKKSWECFRTNCWRRFSTKLRLKTMKVISSTKVKK